MKFLKVLLFAMVFGAPVAQAASISQPTDEPPAHLSVVDEVPTLEDSDTVVSAELLGRAFSYSVNIDHMVTERFNFGIGFSYLGFGDSFLGGSLMVIPVYSNYYFTNNTHRFFGSAGVNYVRAKAKFMYGEATGSTYVGVIGGGYEYRKPTGGFVFRAAPYVFLHGKFIAATVGLSGGFGF